MDNEPYRDHRKHSVDQSFTGADMTSKLNAELFTVEANDPEHNRRSVAAAHETLATQGAAAVPDTVWRHYLRWSARPEVLESLDVATRYEWAADAVALLAHLRYTLGDLLADRAGRCGTEPYSAAAWRAYVHRHRTSPAIFNSSRYRSLSVGCDSALLERT
jgi:hypothetical protein